MEYWVTKADNVLILISHQCQQYKNKSHSAQHGTSVFQHSLIPVPHAIRFHQIRLSLTWPK